MTKLRIFIDFEAISAPFSFKLNIPQDTPYAYSLGIHIGKKFKIKTTIVNFNEIGLDSLYEWIRLDIVEKIRDITGKKDFKVNKDSIQFIGWAPNLEKKILNKSFRGIEVIDQAKGESISLTTLTEKEFDGEYFKTLREFVAKTLDSEFIEKRGLKYDGALAALAGHALYASAKNITNKFTLDIDLRTLVKEIVKYSKEDIIRMSFLQLNQPIFIKRKKELLILNEKKQKLSIKINKVKRTISILEAYDKNMKVSDLLKEQEHILKRLNIDKDNL